MKKNMRTWMYEILNSPDRKAMPVLSFPGAQLKELELIDVVSRAGAQFECIKAVSERFPSIANVTNMDLSVEAEAFGCNIRFTDNEVPTVIKGVIEDISESTELEIPDIGAARTFEYIRAAELASKNIKDRPTFAGMIGPFSLAGRLLDMTEIMVSTMIEPEMTKILLEKTTSFLMEYAKAFKAAGANGLLIAEPAAGLLSPQIAHEFSSVYVRQIVEEVQDDCFMIILHNCGNAEAQVSSMISTGAMGFHFGNAVDMAKIMPQIPWGRVAMGNVDPAGTIKNGTVGEVRAKTAEVLQKTAIYKNFILSSGCDIPYGTPIENIEAFFEALERFNSCELFGESA
jgi:uroporphyrinogen decarboxylase